MTTVVVGGAMAAKAGNGGNAWTRLSWVGAFQRLGFDVWFVEELPVGAERSAAVAWASHVGARHGLADRQIFAPADDARVRELVASSSMVLNISGHLSLHARSGVRGPRLVFLDDDPGFTQIWAATGSRGSRLDGHDLHLTFGTNIGTPLCGLPTNGIEWHPIRPPVLLDEWPATPTNQPDRLTTVTSWRAPFGAVTWGTRTFPMKHHGFRDLFSLPMLAPATYDIATTMDRAEARDLAALEDHGWIVSDARRVSNSTRGYRDWIRHSGAEISAAHGVYAETASGWISDRTAAYLASGRPAIVRSTGAEATIAAGEGFLTFDDVEGAARAVRSVLGDYERHAKAARAIAEEQFDAVAIAARVCELAEGRAVSRRVAIVSGMVAGDPGQGGATWAVLQYLLGLEALGFESVLIEPLGSGGDGPLSSSPAARYFDRVVTRFGLRGRAALLQTASGELHGLDRAQYDYVVGRAEILLNIAGMLPLEPPLDAIPVRAYLDLDPGFNQFWQTALGIDMRFSGHTHHVTVGLCVGQPDCVVPTCDLDWIPTLPPVVLKHWPVACRLDTDALTTVGNWRSYGAIEFEGVHYGQKAHSVRALLELGPRSPKPLHVALGIHPTEVRDRAALAASGWCVADPAAVTATPDAYRDFIGGSWGEIGIAKSGYVTARTGWFSDRSAGYLASGRPVIAQDTGFSAVLPTGRGLLAFDDVDSAVDSIARVADDYDAHRRAAREFAERHLDSARVLPRLLQRLGVG